MRKILIVLFILPLLFFSAYSGLDDVFYQPDHKEYTTPDQDGYPYEAVEFESADGTKLPGWFIPAKGEAEPMRWRLQGVRKLKASSAF